MSTPDDIVGTLKQRAGFELIEVEQSDARLRLVGRIQSPNGVRNDAWILVMQQLLLRAEKAKWNGDISRQYFIRHLDSGPKVFYTWRIIFQGLAAKEDFQDVVATILNAPVPARVELEEIALAGVGRDRNSGVRGKGARTIAAGPTR